MINQVELQFLDKPNKLGALLVNNQVIGFGMDRVPGRNGFDMIAHYTTSLMATDFNPSNPIRFDARTVKGLIGKIRRYKHTLVDFVS